MSDDPHAHPGRTVLPNTLGIQDVEELRRVEADLTSSRAVRIAVQPIPGDYGLLHFLAFHRHLFEDLYEWAGKLRKVPPDEKDRLRDCFLDVNRDLTVDLSREVFLNRLANYLSTLNTLRPFPTGNGRAQRAFFGQLAAEAGYKLDWHHVTPESNIEALDAATRGDQRPLRKLLAEVISPIDSEHIPGEFAPERPPFSNPHETARSYSSAAGVLAGFCFAAIVLLINLQQEAPGRFGSAVGALLTAFLGFVLSAFLSALVAGQTRRSTRSFWMAHLAGITLAISALFALWGLGDVVAVVFSTSDTDLMRDNADLITLVRAVFIVASVLVSAFVAATGVDLLRIAGERNLSDKGTDLVAVALIAVLAAAFLAHLFDVSDKKPIDVIAYFALGALVLAVLGVLYLSSFGRLQDVRGKSATTLTLLLMAVPPAGATFLFFRLPDNRPPDCTQVRATPGIVSRADNQPRLISLRGARDPEGDKVKIAVTGVTQDEPVKAPGAGDSGPDATVGPTSNEVYVLAESSPVGGGRIYRIPFRVSDTGNATCTGTTKVEILPDQGGRAVESGPSSFNSFGQ